MIRIGSCFVPDLKGKAFNFTVEYAVSYGLVYRVHFCFISLIEREYRVVDKTSKVRLPCSNTDFYHLPAVTFFK